MARPQPTTYRRSVVAAIPEHAVWPLPRPAPFAVQRRNRIDQRQGLLRVVPIRACQTHGERHASPVANQMALAPALRPIGGIRTSMVTTMHCADGTAVHDRSRPINLILSSEPIQQREVNEIPHARSLQRRSHIRSRYFAGEDQVSDVLLRALKVAPARWH